MSHTNYLNRFFSLRCCGDVLNTCGPINQGAKEITESFGVLNIIRSIVLKKPMEYTLIDLCAGNALTSVLGVFTLPLKQAYAVDRYRRNRNWHLAQRFEYHEADILSSKIPHRDPAIIVGVHACRSLASRIADIYLENSWAKHLVLMPCCVDKEAVTQNISYPIAKRLGRYMSWALYLAQKVEGKVVEDHHIISPARAIVVSSKDN